MSIHPIEYYDFNLRFYYSELKETAPSAAKEAAPFIRKFLEEIVPSIIEKDDNLRKEHYEKALAAFKGFKRILVRICPDFVDSSDPQELTSDDLLGLSNGYRELGDFIKDNPESRYNLSWLD